MDWPSYRAMARPGGGVDLAEIGAFLEYEARLLDDRLFYEWMELFTDDGCYWAPAAPDQPDPHDSASLFFDDRELMKTRIDRLHHPRIHAQTPPSRTVRVVGHFTLEGVEDGALLIGSNFTMVEYRQDRRRVFAGRYRHRLRRAGDGYAIAMKKVALVDCDGLHEPMSVPI